MAEHTHIVERDRSYLDEIVKEISAVLKKYGADFTEIPVSLLNRVIVYGRADILDRYLDGEIISLESLTGNPHDRHFGWVPSMEWMECSEIPRYDIDFDENAILFEL